MGGYSPKEEWANSATHGLGLVLSLAGLSWLVIVASLRGTVWHVVASGIYGAALVVLYLSSTLYHGFSRPRVKHLFHLLDHMSIYLLIAGSYTPLLLVTLRGVWGWSLFGAVWGLAAGGIVFKAVFAHRFRLASTLIYLLMGWMSLVAIRPMLRLLPRAALFWLLAGGLFYSVGVVAYLLKKIPFHHAVWHVFVLLGSACHYICIMRYVIPPFTP